MEFYKHKNDKVYNYTEINAYKKKKVLNPNIKIRKNSINLLSELIENNPNYVNEKDKNGNTILFYEIEKNNKENMKLILDVDILDLNIKNKDGDSYLHYAIKNKNYNLIHNLIRKGIDLNIQNNLGNSPLHLAYELDDSVAINILIKNNINTRLKNKKGQIAEEINIKNNYDLNNNLNNIDDNYLLKRSNTQTNKNINNLNNFDFNDEDFESMNENVNSEELNKSLNKYKYSYSNNIDNKKLEYKNYFSNSDSNKINKNYNYKNFPEVSTDFISESLNKKENNEDFFNLDTSIDNIKKENKDKVEINFNMLSDDIKKMYDSTALENIKSNKMKFSFPENNFNNLPNDLNSNINNNNLNNDNNNENDIFRHVKGKSKTTQLLAKITFNLNKIDGKKLYDFLLEIKMEKYYNFFITNGFDDINLIIEQTKNNELGINDKELKEIGIQLPGDRAKILIRIQEKAHNFSFKIPENVYYICEDLINIENDNNIIKLNKWLENIKCGFYLNNFISNNYFSLELLLIQMIAKNKLTEEILDEMGIYKIGHKIRILNKLKEDVKNLQNKKLLINNSKESLFDCKIF